MKIPDRYWEGETLLAARLPWLTPKAILALDDYIKPTHSVLELGGGGSTAFFSDRCAKVVTWEPSLHWRLRIARLLGNKAPHCTVIQDLKVALNNNALKRPSQFYDIVLVDNSDADSHRKAMCERALKCVAPGGLFILDNYARYPLKFLTGWQITTHDDPHWDGRGTLFAKRFNQP